MRASEPPLQRRQRRQLGASSACIAPYNVRVNRANSCTYGGEGRVRSAGWTGQTAKGARGMPPFDRWGLRRSYHIVSARGRFVEWYDEDLLGHAAVCRRSSGIPDPHTASIAIRQGGDQLVYVGGLFASVGGQARHDLAALDASTGADDEPVPPGLVSRDATQRAQGVTM